MQGLSWDIKAMLMINVLLLGFSGVSTYFTWQLLSLEKENVPPMPMYETYIAETLIIEDSIVNINIEKSNSPCFQDGK